MMKKQNVHTPFLRTIHPINVEEEKQKFLFDEQYNPQFEYAFPIHQTKYEQFNTATDEYMEQAQAIMNKVIAQYGTETAYTESAMGEILEKEQVERGIKEYIQPYPFKNDVTIHFSSNFMARTSMIGYSMNIREPVVYRKNGFIGMLHHEIGTHLLRRMNEERQPWHQKRPSFALHEYIQTEEGLATINAHVYLDKPYLWLQSVYYAVSFWAETLSFAQLNEKLKTYIDDEERRWKICLRVKRGIQDTSVPGTFSKDQSYFSGAIQVLRWLSEHNYDVTQLYFGKIALEDIDKLVSINPDFVPVLPEFFSKDPKDYAMRVKEMIKVNGITKTIKD